MSETADDARLRDNRRRGKLPLYESQKLSVDAGGGYMEQMDKLLTQDEKEEFPDSVSQSSALSRASSFKKAGFGALVQT